MKYILLAILLPLKLWSQDITGMWVGTLFSDTTRSSMHYEVAISQSNGKYAGYSYTTFVLDNAEVTGVKTLKIVPQKDHFFFEDVELIYNNYPVAPPKGVKQISSVSLTETGSAKVLSGKFITTRTKQYGKQVTGTIRLEKADEPSKTKLIAALEKLGLVDKLSFIAPPKDTASVAVVDKHPKPHLKSSPEIKKIVIPKTDVLTELSKRKVETIQTVYFTNDSLRLSLYDNGYVDGDSISIIVNGKVLLEHQRLSTQAVTKTINTKAGLVDSVNIVMLAENLGSIAPNTGLLVIYDGDKRHEITFSGDLQKNAGILLKRHK